MSRLSDFIFAFALLGASASMAQSSGASQMVPGTLAKTSTVILTGFDPKADTYTAQFHIAVAACPNVVYDTSINIPGVKNEDDARALAKPAIGQVEQDIFASSAKCKPH